MIGVCEGVLLTNYISCDLFNKAYNHMSGCIDKIYKDLTKGGTFPTGGVGFLSLEDADVSGLGSNRVSRFKLTASCRNHT